MGQDSGDKNGKLDRIIEALDGLDRRPEVVGKYIIRVLLVILGFFLVETFTEIKSLREDIQENDKRILKLEITVLERKKMKGP